MNISGAVSEVVNAASLLVAGDAGELVAGCARQLVPAASCCAGRSWQLSALAQMLMLLWGAMPLSAFVSGNATLSLLPACLECNASDHPCHLHAQLSGVSASPATCWHDVQRLFVMRSRLVIAAAAMHVSEGLHSLTPGSCILDVASSVAMLRRPELTSVDVAMSCLTTYLSEKLNVLESSRIHISSPIWSVYLNGGRCHPAVASKGRCMCVSSWGGAVLLVRRAGRRVVPCMYDSGCVR